MKCHSCRVRPVDPAHTVGELTACSAPCLRRIWLDHPDARTRPEQFCADWVTRMVGTPAPPAGFLRCFNGPMTEDEYYTGDATRDYRIRTFPFIEKCAIIEGPAWETCVPPRRAEGTEVITYRTSDVELVHGPNTHPTPELVDTASFGFKCRQQYHRRLERGAPVRPVDWNARADFTCISCGQTYLGRVRIVVPSSMLGSTMYVTRYFGCSIECVRAWLMAEIRFLDQRRLLLLAYTRAQLMVDDTTYRADATIVVQDVVYETIYLQRPYGIAEAIADRRLPEGCSEHVVVQSADTGLSSIFSDVASHSKNNK